MGATLADAGMALMKLMAENHALEEENAALKIEVQRLKGNVTVLDRTSDAGRWSASDHAGTPNPGEGGAIPPPATNS